MSEEINHQKGTQHDTNQKSIVHSQNPHHGWPGKRRVPQLGWLPDIKLSTPGSARIGTNPEQLFAQTFKKI